MARIVEHLPVAELEARYRAARDVTEARYRAARDVTEARHYQAIWLLAQGRTVLEVAEVLAFVPRWVEELAARYNTSGPEALGDRRRRNGRTASLLTPASSAALVGRPKDPPEDGGPWSGPPRSPPGWRGTSVWRRCIRSVAGRRCSGSAGRSKRRGHGIRARRRPSGAAGGAEEKPDEAVARAAAEHPDRPVEVWAEDGWTHRVRPASA